MNLKKLVLTPTNDMDRTQWLSFRKPTFHVERLLETELGWNPCYLQPDQKTHERYQELLTFFKESACWHEFFFPCIGASEMATILGLNDYESSIELYYKKTGVIPVNDFDNAAMFWGRELEKEIAEKWSFWDGTAESMMENFRTGKVIRKCRRINAYMQNKAFPFIFASLDRIINKQGGRVEGSLECKTIAGWSADKWTAGIPPAYLIQNQTQVLVAGFDFGEIAVLKDGRTFDVLPFEKSENICVRILEAATDFFNRVKSGLEFYFLSQAAYTDELAAVCQHHINDYAPEPDGSLAYENYLKQKPDTGGQVLGTIKEHEFAVLYCRHKDQIAEMEEKVRFCSNMLKTALGEASTMTFSGNGDRVTWKANKKGVRVFNVQVN